MAAVGFCGEWSIITCDKKLVAVHTKQTRDLYVFDCGTAEKKPNNTKIENNSDDGASEETGSDRILAFTVSSSGKLVALTDDTKRLVLFSSEPSWQCISIRRVVRRCTALVFSQAEDSLFVADKSGDVYSFSVLEPQREGELKMGHLSMLLAITLSSDDKYIITADRDEKIRVSHLGCPYNIQSFCLGHQQFVSALLVPSAYSPCLLSGSGDGTVKLWNYESGRRLQTWDLTELEETASFEAGKEKVTVCRITSSNDGHFIAVQCERLATVQVFTLDRLAEERLVPHSRLSLPHYPLDVTFDPEGRLWVLLNSNDAPLKMYSHRQGSWECDAENPELIRVCEAFKPHLETFKAASTMTDSKFDHLYKTTYDNVTAYLQKKQQRLEVQQLKRTMTDTEHNKKKAKKETSETLAST